MSPKKAKQVTWGRIVVAQEGVHRGEVFYVRKVEYGIANLRPYPEGGKTIYMSQDKLEVLARA